jgi:hypothetical protein
MNVAELQKKLLAAARRDQPGDRVPFAFEKRVMAHLKSRPRVDLWSDWSRALWKAAAPCVAVMLVLGVWTFYASANDVGHVTLEDAVLAPIAHAGELE